MERQVHMWPFSLLLCLLGLLQSDVGEAQRLVTIQAGPLYRIKDFHVAILCSVSGFQGPEEQHFRFSAYLAKRPDTEIEIISTEGDSFGYAAYAERVRNKDIWIERLSGSSAVLHINKARLEDTSEIECHTPNTDPSFWGTYNAKTSLHVVEDTLAATYSGPSSVTLFEGDTIQLECQASSQTFQHTHLSITWLVLGSGKTEPRPIISLDRDLTVRPGSGYEARYQSRQVGIEKVEETRYQLRMTHVQQGDQGKILCRVQQWIQDPDREWVTIANRDAQAADVIIKAVEVTADKFAAHIKVTSVNLQEGESMEVHCSVEAQNLPERFFTMAWFKGEQEMARLGPLGTLTVMPDYAGREKEGELRAVKTTEKDYLLTLVPVKTEDQGQYQCRVWQEQRSGTGEFTQGQSERSNPQQVTITAKESGLSVSMPPDLSVTEGAPLTLSCNVSGAYGELSVTWQHKKDSQGSSFSDVISLTRVGVMELGSQYQQRALRTFRSLEGSVVLEMGEATVADGGVYRCTVSEWTNGGTKKTTSQSQQCSVQVTSLDTLVKVSLRSRTVSVKVNEKIRLMCNVKSPKVPLSVKWLFQRHGSASTGTVVSVLHTGDVVWDRERDSYQVSVAVKEDSSQYELEVTRASLRNAGLYKCQVEAYLKQTQRTSKTSNPLGVQVQKPASELSLSHHPTSPLKSIVNSDIQMSCKVAKATSNSSRFAITWQVDGRPIASTDRDGIVTLQDAGQRTGVSTLPGPTFQLTLRQTGASDSGHYLCQVEEWDQDPAGEWYSLPPHNDTVELVISEKPSDFKMYQEVTDIRGHEGGEIDVFCSIVSGTDDPSSHFSLTWLFQSAVPDSPASTLLTYSHQGDLSYGDRPAGLQKRLRFSRPEHAVFHLTVASAEPGDSGEYWCMVEQYQHGCSGTWEKKGSQKSGVSQVKVEPIEARLRLQKTNQSMVVTNPQNGFKLECPVLSRSSDQSVFEVVWSRTQGTAGEDSQMVFSARRDGTLHTLDGSKDVLAFNRPNPTHFSLTFPTVGPSEVGTYSCHVSEWLPLPGNKWRKLAEDQSGELTINLQTKVKSNFSMTKDTMDVSVNESQRLDLQCSVGSEGSDPSSSSYNVIWLFRSPDSSGSVALLTQNFDGHLTLHKKYQDRLRFSHPAKQTFGLTILNAVPEDSGAYNCRVDLYQYDCGGQWKAMASDQSGLITVSVHKLEGNLRLKKDVQHLNVTELKPGFKVDCIIISQSSEESLFEVTWFRTQGTNNQKDTLFRVTRNGTLQSFDKARKGLVFGRPKVTLFTLTVPEAGASDSGQYTCKVVEWVRTLTNTWKKMAEDQSGVLNVNVHTGGGESQGKHGDPCSVTTPVLVVIMLVLVAAVVLLALKQRKANAAQKKHADSLWAENNPLKPTNDA